MDDDATIDPVGAYEPVPRLPGGGGRRRQPAPGSKPTSRRPEPSAPAPPPANPGPGAPDAEAPRGRRIDDRA
jgi:hypothetical protein